MGFNKINPQLILIFSDVLTPPAKQTIQDVRKSDIFDFSPIMTLDGANIDSNSVRKLMPKTGGITCFRFC